jgi:hypothetical protein
MKRLAQISSVSTILLAAIIGASPSARADGSGAGSGSRPDSKAQIKIGFQAKIFEAPHLAALLIPHPEEITPKTQAEIAPYVSFSRGPVPEALQSQLLQGYLDGLETEKRLKCEGARPAQPDEFDQRTTALLDTLAHTQPKPENRGEILPLLIYVDGFNAGLMRAGRNLYLCQGTPDA